MGRVGMLSRENHPLPHPGQQYQHTIASILNPSILFMLFALAFVDCSVIYLFLWYDQMQ